MKRWLRDTPEIPEGLRGAYLLVLAPVAMLAPVPLFWTEGVLPLALAAYELSLLLLWWRARSDHPVRLSDSILNALGISYFVWLGVEVAVFHHGLLRSVSHLLLFTAIAKLASLKRPGEARTALLVLFLITLASASSATHVASLLYFAAMAFLGFRALGRLAVLADFDEAPPDRVLRAVPTRGVAATVIVAAALVTAPLFYALPRVRSPYVTARIRIDDALSTALAADRVDLEGFGAAKRSDRVVLRMLVAPDRLRPRVLRLREAVFTDYRGGVWTRDPHRTGFVTRRGARTASLLPGVRPDQALAGRVAIDLNPFVNGFLFLPYEAVGLALDRGYPVALTDGIVRLSASRRSVRYTAAVRRSDPRGLGASAIDPAVVPPEIREYAARIAGDVTDPAELARRIRENFSEKFVYTLDPPRGTGDPIVHFLLRSRAGHCEFFASAAALMLTARGIPARLVTGSYGGEAGFFSSAILVRGTNLHAWVEAELDGSGFSVFDPTPAGGVPPAVSQGSFWRGIANLGRESESFYDRRILGFDAMDQAQFLDVARQSVGSAAESVSGWRPFSGPIAPAVRTAAAVLVALSLLAFLRSLRARRSRVPAPTRAYLRLRGMLARRLGGLSASTPPAEVARLFAEEVPDAGDDARAVVAIYCESAFGGRDPAPGAQSELVARLRRLRKLA